MHFRSLSHAPYLFNKKFPWKWSVGFVVWIETYYLVLFWFSFFWMIFARFQIFPFSIKEQIYRWTHNTHHKSCTVHNHNQQGSFAVRKCAAKRNGTHHRRSTHYTLLSMETRLRISGRDDSETIQSCIHSLWLARSLALERFQFYDSWISLFQYLCSTS